MSTGPGARVPGPAPSPALPRTTALLLHAGFLLTGVATVLLGPAIPELAAHWGVPPGALAPLFTAQFLVSSLGSVLSSRHPWLGVRIAYPCIAVGVLGLALGGPRPALPSAALLGLGLGLAIPSSNLLVAAANRHRRGAALATLNLMWGVGAVACPLVFAALRSRVAVPWILAGLGLAVAAVAAVLATRQGPPRQQVGAGGPALPAATGATAAVHPSTLPLFAGMLFLYVGAEGAVGGWLVTLADQIGGATAASMLVHSAFWGSLLAGRLLASLLLRRMPEMALFTTSLAVAAGGVGALLVADSRATVALAAAVCGLGMAAVFPLIVSRLTAATEASGSRRVGWVFAFGGAGGAVLPWCVPRVAPAGSLQSGFAVPLAAVLLIALLLGLHRALQRNPRPTAGPGRGRH